MLPLDFFEVVELASWARYFLLVPLLPNPGSFAILPLFVHWINATHAPCAWLASTWFNQGYSDRRLGSKRRHSWSICFPTLSLLSYGVSGSSFVPSWWQPTRHFLHGSYSYWVLVILSSALWPSILVVIITFHCDSLIIALFLIFKINLCSHFCK